MYKVKINDNRTCHIRFEDQKWYVDKAAVTADIRQLDTSSWHMILNDRSYRISIPDKQSGQKKLEVYVNGRLYKLDIKDQYDQLLKELGIENMMGKRAEPVKSPMPGKVLEVHVKAGDAVKADETLLILEAMKMENVIKAPADAVVKDVSVNQGDSVEKNQALITFE